MAELVADITEDTGELEVSAVSVASSIVEQLTIAAIEQPEVYTICVCCVLDSGWIVLQ